MNRNIPLFVLIMIFLFSIIFPVGNSLYLFGELSSAGNDRFPFFYIVSLFLEVAALVMMVAGVHDPKARRIGAYVAFGLPGLHYAAVLVGFLVSATARQFIGVVFMVVLTAAYAVTAAMAYMTLRSVGDMEPTEREGTPPVEINACVESLHEKLDSNR
jgi:hypothetical protein